MAKKKKPAKKPKKPRKPKVKYVTLYDVNRNPISVPEGEVEQYLHDGYTKKCPPAQEVDPLDTPEGRFNARRPSIL